MVNDRRRSRAIEQSIAALDLHGKTVFEIGSGTGLVALLFAKHGAARVISCETDPTSPGVAQQITAETPYADCVTIIEGSSTEVIDRAVLSRRTGRDLHRDPRLWRRGRRLRAHRRRHPTDLRVPDARHAEPGSPARRPDRLGRPGRPQPGHHDLRVRSAPPEHVHDPELLPGAPRAPRASPPQRSAPGAPVHLPRLRSAHGGLGSCHRDRNRPRACSAGSRRTSVPRHGQHRAGERAATGTRHSTRCPRTSR